MGHLDREVSPSKALLLLVSGWGMGDVGLKMVVKGWCLAYNISYAVSMTTGAHDLDVFMIIVPTFPYLGNSFLAGVLFVFLHAFLYYSIRATCVIVIFIFSFVLYIFPLPPFLLYSHTTIRKPIKSTCAHAWPPPLPPSLWPPLLLLLVCVGNVLMRVDAKKWAPLNVFRSGCCSPKMCERRQKAFVCFAMYI